MRGAASLRSSESMILRAGYIGSRCLSTSITKISRRGHRCGHPERLVHVVDRLARTALVVRLDEDLSALVQGQLGLAFEDEHHLDVADAPARPPQPFRGPRKVHARRLLEGRDERRGGATRFEQVVGHWAVSAGAGSDPGARSALNLSGWTPSRHSATSRSMGRFASSSRIWSSRACVAGRGGPRRSQISGPFETSYVPITFARSTISCLSNPISGRVIGRLATASLPRRLARVWLET